MTERRTFSDEDISEFLLNNSVSEEDYRRNLLEVLALGIDPLLLDPAHLDRNETWQRAESYQDLIFTRRSS